MEVKGYPNYLIYPDGRVSSKRFPDRFLKPQTSDGYLIVMLCKNSILKKHRIHRLVATHYIANPDNKPQVDHINRDRKDNRIENLRWVTPTQNSQNTGVSKNNKLGIKNIYIKGKYYGFKKSINGVTYNKHFRTLKEALCYKYIFILKMRAGLV